MLKTIAILLAIVAYAQAQIVVGLSQNASARCSSSCNWNDATIWDPEHIPGTGDSVTLMATAVLNLVIDTPIDVANFVIDDTKKNAQKLQILGGGSLAVTGTSIIGYTATILIENGGSFTVAGQVTNQGKITVSGNFSCLSAQSPSLDLDTKNAQISANQVYATVTLDNGFLIVPGGVHVSSTANLVGSGYVLGDVSSTGTISMGTDTAVGTLYINGRLDLSTTTTSVGSSQLKVKVASSSSFDHIIISGAFVQDGDLRVAPLSGYQPLAHSQFVFANHSNQRGGFDSVRGSGFSGIFNNEWTVGVDQQYTFVIFGSASTVAVSFVLLIACAILSSF